MKKYLIFSILIFFFMIINSCGNKVLYKVTYIPCEYEETKGFLDSDGNFTPMNDVEFELTPVTNGLFMADGTLYKVDDDVTDTSSVVLHDVSKTGVVSDGLIPVSKEFDYISIIDEDGNLKFQLKEYEGKEVLECYSFSDSKMRVKLEDESYIYIDTNGKKILEKSFSWATDFKKGYAITQSENQNEDLYSLIKEDGSTIFKFESSDEEEIAVSFDLELVCGKDNERIIIYNFEGKQVLECNSKVDQIYSFCPNGFIFCNEDEEYGFMSYDGVVLIKARYDYLVPHGKNFLALIDDDDEEVLLIDENDNVIRRYDGEKILDFKHYGFDFPNIIIDDNDKCIIIDDEGNIVKEDLDIEIDIDDVINSNKVVSEYIPKNKIINLMTELCNYGNGISQKFGAFFIKDSRYCHPNDIQFLNSIPLSNITSQYFARLVIDNGLNYALSYFVCFNEPIVKADSTSLNPSACLSSVEIGFDVGPYLSSSTLIKNLFIKKMLEFNCTEYYKINGCVMLENKDHSFIYTVVPASSKNTEYRIIIRPKNEINVSNLINFMRNKK